MALTADEITLCNAALSQIGHCIVEASQTTANEYVFCERFLSMARDEVLRRHPWNCVTQKVVTHRIGHPAWGYNHLYLKPTDCLRVVSLEKSEWKFEVDSNGIITDYGGLPNDWETNTEYAVGDYVQYDDDSNGTKTTFKCNTAHTSATFAGDSAKWTSIGDEVYVLKIIYIKKETDPTKWDQTLYNLIALRLAMFVCLPLGAGTKTRAGLNEEFMKIALPQARSVDSHEGVFGEMRTQTWIDSRR